MTKKHKILKTVQGSRDGITVETFEKDSVHDDLPDDLVANFFEQGVISDTKATGPKENKADQPDETKDGEAGVDLSTQNVEGLVALARDTYGLDVDSTTDEATLRELIEQADGKKPKKRKR